MSGILHEHSSFFDLAFRILDIAIVVLVSIALQFLYPEKNYQLLLKTFLIYGSALTLFIFPFFKLYRSWRGVSLFTEFKALFLAWFCVLLAFNLFILVMANEAQRQVLWPYGLLRIKLFWVWAGFIPAIMAGMRILLRNTLHLFRRMGRNRKSVVIIGAGDLGRRVCATIKKNAWLGYRVSAFFDDNKDLQGRKVDDVLVPGTIDDLVPYMNGYNIDVVFIALPMDNKRRIKDIMQGLNDTTVDVFLVPDVFNLYMISMSLTELAGLPVININNTAINTCKGCILKWFEDYILTCVILVFISPVFLLIALAVRLTSPGPVFFKQRRYGFNGESFVVYKFRTMAVCEDGDTIIQAGRRDPRVTSLGVFLRRTSLDELPQFINVLQGHMSIVGPRPHAVAHNEMYRKLISSYMLRHKVKPGITGWAQINGWRGETDTLEKMEKRVEYDLFYITHWSVWLDIRVMVVTIFKGFIGKNAY